MNVPATAQESVYALAVMAGVLRYCPAHQIFYRGSEGPEAAKACFDKHIAEVRKFFASPVAFYTAVKHVRSKHPETYCPRCTDAVSFV